MKELTGWHVFGMFGTGFGVIIAVNMTLAYNAVQSFPGVEVKNSYVASQAFDANRAAQEALDWDVSAKLRGDRLTLSFAKDGRPVAPEIQRAVFGRATSVAADQFPVFSFDGTAYTAAVDAGHGNWNLRVVAEAADGTLFQQRLIVDMVK